MLPTKRFITRDFTACVVLLENSSWLAEEEELLWRMPVIHAPGRSASVFTPRSSDDCSPYKRRQILRQDTEFSVCQLADRLDRIQTL